MDNHYRKMLAVKSKRLETSTKLFEESSLKRLMKILDTKFKTTFIGDIASVEKFLGFLWGHDKPDKSEEEQRIYDIWQLCRKEMLDKGNHQRRCMQEEIQEYTVYWNRHHLELKGDGNES